VRAKAHRASDFGKWLKGKNESEELKKVLTRETAETVK